MAKRQKKQMKQVVVWKAGARIRNKSELDPVLVDAELEKIRKKHNGDCPPEAVIAAARSKRNYLHPTITWDDAEAAHSRRLDEATALIRAIHVEYVDHPELGSSRKYEVEPGAYAPAGKRRSFRPVEEMLQDDETRAAMLKRALSELVTFQRRYRRLQELAIVIRSIDKILETTEIKA